jgi:aspartate beta-hydroxylase
MKEVEARALVGEGLAALQGGNTELGINLFTRVAEAGLADASLYLALAAAHSRRKDFVHALSALNSSLQLAPQDMRANILKADILEEQGDSRSASAYYLAALKAAPDRASLPADLQIDLARAQARCNAQTDALEVFVRGRLVDQASEGNGRSARFNESIDILFQRKRPYFQEPKYYFFPGLPHIQFFDRADFPWLVELEGHTEAIRSELRSVLANPTSFRPYVEGAVDRPYKAQQGMLNNPDWSAFYLWKHGQIVEENAARCPATMRALESVPLTRVANRSPSVLFSLLRPGAHIPAHNGLVNTRMIGHLPLIVPPGCEFRVGNESRFWEEGKAWLFDDTIEHEAWNRSDQTRVILLFEVWRDELTVAEREGICALFEGIDAQTGRKPEWDI